MSTLDPTTPTTVQIRLTLPAPLLDRYKACAAEQDVEDYLANHLSQTIAHDHSGAGLYFNADQARKLCKLTGRGPTTDPDKVIERLQSLATVRVNKVMVELDAQTLDRMKHNRRAVIDPPAFIAREATNGVREAVGLSRR